MNQKSGGADKQRDGDTRTNALRKDKGPSDFSPGPRVLLVGRVGIEPTTNGLRVQGTCAPGARKPKKRNGGFAGVRPAVRDRTYAEPYVSGWSGADPFQTASTA